MAATKDKYSKNTLNDQNTTVAGVTTPQIYALMPLALNEYRADPTNQHPEQTQVADEENFKALFFCHAVWYKKDTDGKQCAIGLLDTRAGITNSHYREMHGGCSATQATANADPHKRNGKLRITKNGINYMVLNDGGLNTKPWVEIRTVDLCAQNMLIFTLDYKNAYYAITTAARLTIERWVPSGSTWVNSGQKWIVSINTLPVAAKSSGTDFSFLVEDAMNALAFEEGDKAKIYIKIYNEETGAYTSSTATPYVSNEMFPLVEEAIYTLQIYKITSLDDTPQTDGVEYRCIIRPEDYEDRTSDTDPEQNLHYLLNVYGAGTNHPVQTFLNGQIGAHINKDILTTFLPDGMYYGFPADWPGNYPEDEGTYNPHNRVVYIRSDAIAPFYGQAYMWNYLSQPGPGPGPIEPDAEFSAFSVVIDRTRSWAVYSGADYEVHIYCNISATSTHSGTGSFQLQLVQINDNGATEVETDILQNPKVLAVTFTSSASSSNPQTITIPQSEQSETQGEESVDSGHIGTIDFVVTPQSSTSQSSQYNFVLRVLSCSPDSQSITFPVESVAVSLDDLLGIK